MRVLIIGHAYAASYNRKDKLARIAAHEDISRLGLVVPKNWRDRMLGVSRDYESVPVDGRYDTYLMKPLFSGSQIRHLYNPFTLAKIIHEFAPDVIHIEQELHDWVTGEIVWLNRSGLRNPVSVFIWENLRRNYNLVSKVTRKFSLRNVDLVVGGNKEAVRIIREEGFDGKTTVIPQFGVDTDRFQPLAVDELQAELNLQGTFVFGFVGRFVSEKGIHTLVKAVQKLSAQNINFRLVLLSSMQPPEWLRKETAKIDGIKFISQIPHEDFPKYMNLFDVLILPSETQAKWKEQFGRVMIEAMACGVPVIGSDSGAIPEVIGDNGWVFPEKDADKLAQLMKDIIANRNTYFQQKNQVREYVLREYTHDVVVDKLIQEWAKLVNADK